MDTSELARAKYVRLTTFRRDGTAVTCPVWLAPVGGAYAFTTDLTSGKVKRLRHDERVEVSVSDARGRVAGGARVYAGKGRVVTGDEADRAQRAILAKYRVLGRLLTWSARLARAVRRRAPDERGAVEVRLTATR